MKFTEEWVMWMTKHVCVKNDVYKLFKEGWNCIQDEDRPGRQAHNGEHTWNGGFS